MQNKIFERIILILFSDTWMFYEVFLLPQVKRCRINTYNRAIYQLPHKLPNDLTLRILGNYQTLAKCLNFIE